MNEDPFNQNSVRSDLLRLLPALLVLAAVLIAAGRITAGIERSQRHHDYLQIATGILSEEVAPEGTANILRQWAAEYVTRYAPIPFTAEQKDALASGQGQLRWYYNDGGYEYLYNDGGYEYPEGVKPEDVHVGYEPVTTLPTGHEQPGETPGREGAPADE